MAKLNLFRGRNTASSDASTAAPSTSNSQSNVAAPGSDNLPKSERGLTGKIPNVTFRTVFMALLVAMGGFIFGYDTGQISGFLEMAVFLERFGQPTTNLDKYPTGFYFSYVRSGLIVGLVS